MRPPSSTSPADSRHANVMPTTNAVTVPPLAPARRRAIIRPSTRRRPPPSGRRPCECRARRAERGRAAASCTHRHRHRDLSAWSQRRGVDRRPPAPGTCSCDRRGWPAPPPRHRPARVDGCCRNDAALAPPLPRRARSLCARVKRPQKATNTMSTSTSGVSSTTSRATLPRSSPVVPVPATTSIESACRDVCLSGPGSEARSDRCDGPPHRSDSGRKRSTGATDVRRTVPGKPGSRLGTSTRPWRVAVARARSTPPGCRPARRRRHRANDWPAAAPSPAVAVEPGGGHGRSTGGAIREVRGVPPERHLHDASA